jgi:uncharacterized membrane protein YphA (DoxX/SURF4 family)
MAAKQRHHPTKSTTQEKLITITVWVLRILVGGFFIFSGFTKINDVGGFAIKLDKYWYAFEELMGGGWTALSAASWGIAAFTAVFETVIGLFLILGTLRAFTTWMLLLMIIFFTLLTGWAAITKSVSDCGCFGAAFTLEPWQSFTKDVVLLALIGFLFINKQYIMPVLGRVPWAQIGISALGVVATIGFTGYTSAYLPVVDFRPCKIGADFSAITQMTRDEAGKWQEAELHGYMPLGAVCEVDEMSGERLLVFMKDMTAIKAGPMLRMQELNAELKQTDILMLGLTNTNPDKVSDLQRKYSLDFCISPQDQDLIKTCIRSNPGFVLLKDGIIQGKWSANNIPTVTVLNQALKRQVNK